MLEGNLDFTINSLHKCKDYSTLLLLCIASDDYDKMLKLVDESEKHGQLNVTFTAALFTQQHSKCVDCKDISTRFSWKMYITMESIYF
jgi:hypothetical protein